MKITEQHIACPCGKSSDAYCKYEDGHGWCFSCDKGFFPKNYYKKPDDFEVMRDTGYRGIDQKVADLYGCKTYGEDGQVMYRTYEYPAEVAKVRRVGDKSFTWQGKGNKPALWGTWLFNMGCSHYITVVEGEEDAMAAFQMLNTGKATLHPVVSLNGGLLNKDRHEIYKYLSSFQTVKLAIEDDEAGKKNKAILAEMLPNKIKEIKLNKHKDANAYLINGDTKEFATSWFNAKVFTPDNIYHTQDDYDKILNDNLLESYVPTPFVGLNEKIKGLPLNHVTLITGMEGMGKTEILRAFEYQLLKEGKSVAILHFEETKAKTLRALACYELGDNVRNAVPLPKKDDPDYDAKMKEFKEDRATVMGAVAKLTNDFSNLYIFEFKNAPNVDAIVEQVNYLVHVCGVEYVCVDPINQFDPVDDTSRVEFLDDLSKRLEKYCAANPCGLLWTAHVDDEGRTRNSRMIAKACSIRIDVKRDHMADDEQVRNSVEFHVSKNRPYSETGFAGFGKFVKESFTVQDAEVRDSLSAVPGVENSKSLGVPF